MHRGMKLRAVAANLPLQAAFESPREAKLDLCATFDNLRRWGGARRIRPQPPE